jgi:hypothetical protein
VVVPPDAPGPAQNLIVPAQLGVVTHPHKSMIPVQIRLNGPVGVALGSGGRFAQSGHRQRRPGRAGAPGGGSFCGVTPGLSPLPAAGSAALPGAAGEVVHDGVDTLDPAEIVTRPAG